MTGVLTSTVPIVATVAGEQNDKDEVNDDDDEEEEEEGDEEEDDDDDDNNNNSPPDVMSSTLCSVLDDEFEDPVVQTVNSPATVDEASEGCSFVVFAQVVSGE